jgi:hypothetical protein
MIGLTAATLAVVLLIAVTQGVAGGDPHESGAEAVASVVIEPESMTTLVATCPRGKVAQGGALTIEPVDALVTATAGISSSGSAQWAVGVVSADRRPVTVIATATCGPDESRADVS